eukprot:2064453-Pyramimonas_sp.AAC.1
MPFVVAGDWHVPPDVMVNSDYPLRLRAVIHAGKQGTYKDPATGNLSTLDYWMVSDFLATVLQQPTRVGGFPARQHFPMAVPLGPHPRGQQL